jgi:hypothetical protein
VDLLAGVLFDAALSGTTDVSDQALSDIEATVAAAADLGALGRMLAVVLTMWRHDRILGTARSATLGVVIVASVRRVLWLAEGVHGRSAAADPGRIGALAACRDALRYTRSVLDLDLAAALEVAARISADEEAPPDLRGAAFGLRWALQSAQHPTDDLDPVRAVRGAFQPQSAGDWLAGLFALAREEVLHTAAVIGLLDELLSGMASDDFLIAVPALRQAFEFFPPREREIVASRLLERRGLVGTGRGLLRGVADPQVVAAGMLLDDRVDTVLRRAGLMGGAHD